MPYTPPGYTSSLGELELLLSTLYQSLEGVRHQPHGAQEARRTLPGSVEMSWM
jgi:hypothetical protein